MDVGPLNRTQYVPGQEAGHYESFYQRANHPARPLAFWIRYTIFSPHRRPQDAVGELWAIVFDGETGRHVAVKEERPLAECRFERDGFGARIAAAVLSAGRLAGRATIGANTIGWDLAYAGAEPPVYLLPPSLYEAKLPRAKSLVGVPMARFDGTMTVNGRTIAVDDWIGSQNHNWGSRHTDHYAFGQVAGFDDARESFLEIVSARIKVGPLWMPMLTPLVLRHHGRDHAFITIPQAIRAKATFRYFDWSFAVEDEAVKLEGRIQARREDFVALTYRNPPGGTKQCLNTKIADCALTLTDKASGTKESLNASRRAAFEILTDDREHGVPVQV